MSLELITESRAKQLIHNFAGATLEASFTSYTQQDAPYDSVDVISFGDFIAGSNGVPVAISGVTISENGLIQYNPATKVFTVLKGGYFGVKTRQRAQRVGASAGVSDLFVQAQISINGGASWLPTGNSVDLKLDDDRQVEIFFDFSQVYFPAGVKLRQVYGRSSNGTNFGSLVVGTPSAGLSSAGITVAPSAQVTIYRLNNQYGYK